MDDFFHAITLALAIYSKVKEKIAEIKAHQPVVIGDPLTDGPVMTYLGGAHVAIGPIPINPVAAASVQAPAGAAARPSAIGFTSASPAP